MYSEITVIDHHHALLVTPLITWNYDYGNVDS